MYDRVNFEDFVDKTVEMVLINSAKDSMLWSVDGKWYRVDAYGDCCSHSWFNHCDNADVFRGAKLLGVEYVDSDTFEEEYETIQVNMLKFKTEKGYCTVEFRNASNGYYSGWTEIRPVEDSAGEDKDFKLMTDF